MNDFFFDIPVFWEKLSDEERKDYLAMKKAISSKACKSRRSKSVETFADVLETIKKFVMRGDKGDMIRGIVCGMYWPENGDLAINTRQLRTLLNKCKSSINGSLQSLGYVSPHQTGDSQPNVLNIFPFWKDNFRELRQWTLRRKLNESKISILPEPIDFSNSEFEENEKEAEAASSSPQADDKEQEIETKEPENVFAQKPQGSFLIQDNLNEKSNDLNVELRFSIPSYIDEEFQTSYENSNEIWEMQLAQEFNI